MTRLDIQCHFESTVSWELGEEISVGSCEKKKKKENR